MADDITNTVLLEHMQGMKYELQKQITELKDYVMHPGHGLVALERRLTNFQEETRQNFVEVRQDIHMLSEDLYATMRIVHRHEKKLAKI